MRAQQISFRAYGLFPAKADPSGHIIVAGPSGSGKTENFTLPAISQLASMGMSGTVYADCHNESFSEKIAMIAEKCGADFYNFDPSSTSHWNGRKINVLHADLLCDIADAKHMAEAMLNARRSSGYSLPSTSAHVSKTDCAIDILTSIIWYLKNYSSSFQPCCLASVIAFSQESVLDQSAILAGNSETAELMSPIIRMLRTDAPLAFTFWDRIAESLMFFTPETVCMLSGTGFPKFGSGPPAVFNIRAVPHMRGVSDALARVVMAAGILASGRAPGAGFFVAADTRNPTGLLPVRRMLEGEAKNLHVLAVCTLSPLESGSRRENLLREFGTAIVFSKWKRSLAGWPFYSLSKKPVFAMMQGSGLKKTVLLHSRASFGRLLLPVSSVNMARLGNEMIYEAQDFISDLFFDCARLPGK